ncbi:hypothetical protein KC333_g3283 [Hortaea werneckii]|nr:hypothetical protein KC333_g3283 [Hortaea werneckii]KAI7317057.1 hypothetical protein KC326_g4116 [Hortaea werneckii]
MASAPQSAVPAFASPPSKPVDILSSQTSQLYSNLHPILLSSILAFSFKTLVHDPVNTLLGLAPTIAILQALYCVICLPSTGQTPPPVRKPGEKKKPQKAGQDIWAKIVPAFLSLTLTLFLSAPLFFLLAILFGAPLTSHLLHTLFLALHLALLTTPQLYYAHGLEAPKWMHLVSLQLPVDEVLGMSLGACVGAWVGAIPIPLDWDREWQKWPVTVVVGMYAGAVLGKLLGGIYSYLIANPLTRFEHVHILNHIPLSHPLTRTCKQLRHECTLFPRPTRAQDFAQTKYLHVTVRDFDFTRFLEWFEEVQDYQGKWWRSERFAPTLRRVEFTVELGSSRLPPSSSSEEMVVGVAERGDWMGRFEVGIEGMLNRPKKLLGCAAGPGLVVVEFRILFNWNVWSVEDAERMYGFVHGSDRIGGPERYRLRMAILRALNERRRVLGLEVQREREEFGTHWKRGRSCKGARRVREGDEDEMIRVGDLGEEGEEEEVEEEEVEEEEVEEEEEEEEEEGQEEGKGEDNLPAFDGMEAEEEELVVRELDGAKVKLARKSRSPEILGSDNED